MKPLALFGCLAASTLALVPFSCASKPGNPPAASLKQRLLCGCPTSAGRRERRALAKQTALSFLQTDNDTIFLMESINLENLQPVGRVWTRKGTADYAYNPGSKSFHFNAQYFSSHHIGLVEKFDSAALRAERVLMHTPGYTYVHGYRHRMATRLVRTGRQQSCSSFSFVEIIPLKRE